MEVDARGLLCPQPLLALKAALRRAAPGTEVVLRATDPHTELDIEAFCAHSGHQLLAVLDQGGEQQFHLRVTNPVVRG